MGTRRAELVVGVHRTLDPVAREGVISAIGTRHYYMDRGFERGEYYLVKKI